MKNRGVREASLAGIDSVLIVVRPGLRRSFSAAIHVLDGQTQGGDGLVSLGDMSEEPFLSDGGGLSERCCCHLRCVPRHRNGARRNGIYADRVLLPLFVAHAGHVGTPARI